jgi:hypothetical protein
MDLQEAKLSTLFKRQGNEIAAQQSFLSHCYKEHLPIQTFHLPGMILSVTV